MAHNILVTYFSASGVTKNVASKIATTINGTLFEIEPETPYSKADLDWMDKHSRSTLEMKDPNSRPVIKNKIDNMDDFDVVFIGFPIWWYIAPSIINTFLESYNFTGKTIIPFATSGGSGLGQTEAKLQEICNGNVIWKPARLIPRNISSDDIKSWVSSLL